MRSKKTSDRKAISVIFFTHYTQLYGANRSLLNLIDGLKNKINPVVVVPGIGDITKELEKRKVDFIISKNVFFFHKKVIGIIKLPLKLIHFTVINLRLLQLLKKIKPSLLYSNSLATYSGIFLSKIMHLPHIWHARELMEMQFKLKSDLGTWLNNYLLNQSSHIISNSKFTKENILSKVFVPISVVYNGVISTANINNQSKKADSISKDKMVISIIGRIMRDKGQLEAIHAFKEILQRIDNIELWIVGSIDEGDYFDEIIHYIEKANIKEYVKFKGYIKNIDEIYQNTYLLLMCSNYEAMGRVTVEALSRGIPVIGKNKAGTKELILHNENGYLYNNVFELEQYLTQLIENQLLYSKISKKALDEAYRNFTIEEYSNKIYNIMKSVVK